MDEIIDNFNSVAMQLLEELRKIIPHSLILNNADLLKNIVQKEESKNVIIDNFLLHVLKFKDEIDNNNEDFFIKNDFQDVQKKTKTPGIIHIINEIKNLWKDIGNGDEKLAEQNKQNIFDYFKVLCFYAEQYFIEIDKED